MVYRNVIRLGLLGVGSGLATYHFDELETAGIGALRFGRAAVTVSKRGRGRGTELENSSSVVSSNAFYFQWNGLSKE